MILEVATLNVRDSPKYQDWKRLLHHFYDPFPVVEHFERVPLDHARDVVREYPPSD